MDHLATREPEEMSLSTYKKHTKRQGAELLWHQRFNHERDHFGETADVLVEEITE